LLNSGEKHDGETMTLMQALNPDGHGVKCPSCGAEPGRRCWGNEPFANRAAHMARIKTDRETRVLKLIAAHREAVYNDCIDICIQAQEGFSDDDDPTDAELEAARIEGRIRALLDSDEHVMKQR